MGQSAMMLDEVVVSIIKAFFFVPVMGLIGWWIFSAYLEKALSLLEAVSGLFLLGVAILLGTVSIANGGWGFLGILGLVYLTLLALAAWEYIYHAKKKQEFLAEEIEKYNLAIERDPTNAAAYSYLGRTYMKLNRGKEAVEALEKAIAIDPTSRYEATYLQHAQELYSRQQAKKK
jgi:tetratricopeptide (TPR) repeat protein